MCGVPMRRRRFAIWSSTRERACTGPSGPKQKRREDRTSSQSSLQPRVALSQVNLDSRVNSDAYGARLPPLSLLSLLHLLLVRVPVLLHLLPVTLYFPHVRRPSAFPPTHHPFLPVFSNSQSLVTLRPSHPAHISSPLIVHPSRIDHMSSPSPMTNPASNPAQTSTPFPPPRIHLSPLAYLFTAFPSELGKG